MAPSATGTRTVSPLAVLLRPATEKLLTLAALRPADRVVDVGCDDGAASILAAGQLAEGGCVIGVDPSAVAVEAARANAAAVAAERLSVEAGQLDALPLAPESMDVAFTQLGLSRVPSPAAVASQVLRVLKPGGRFAAMVLGAADHNDVVTLPHQVLVDAGRNPEPLSRLFALGSVQRLTDALTSAGFVNVAAQAVSVAVTATGADDLWAVAAHLAGWPDTDLPDVRDRLAALCSAPGGTSLHMQIVFGLANKPANAAEAHRPKSFAAMTRAVRVEIPEMTPFEARRGIKGAQVVFLDVREDDERGGGMLPDSVHVPRGVLELRIAAAVADPNTPIIVYSEDGGRGALSVQTLLQLGYQRVWNLAGGLAAWQRTGYDIAAAQG